MKHSSASNFVSRYFRRIAALLGVMALAAGCLPSLNPLYTGKDLIFDRALVGKWVGKEDEKEFWTFSQRDENSYTLMIHDEKEQSPFIVHLVKLGDHRFLDLMPDREGFKETKLEGLFQFGFIQGHLLAKVDQSGPALRLAFLNIEWVDKLLEKDPKAIAHHRIDDKLVALTASTKELQAFVLKYAGDIKAFTDPMEMLKVSTPAAPDGKAK